MSSSVYVVGGVVSALRRGDEMGHSGDHPCSIEQEVYVDELVRNKTEARQKLWA